MATWSGCHVACHAEAPAPEGQLTQVPSPCMGTVGRSLSGV
jgi:hypothetical protein